jgi:hypothetical protein
VTPILGLLLLVGVAAFAVPAAAQIDHEHAPWPLADPGPPRLLPEAEVDIARLVRELQWTASDPRDLSMIWLVPPSLMRALLVQGGDVSPEEVADALRVFDPYILVGVIRGQFAEDGSPRFESARTLYTAVRVIDDRGHVFYPELAPDSLAVQAMIEMHKTLAMGLGDLGAHTTFLLFPARSADGHELFPLDRRALFHVELTALGGLPAQRVTWRLPFAALLVDRVCPVCGEAFNGAWWFCPWDGTPLVAAGAQDTGWGSRNAGWDPGEGSRMEPGGDRSPPRKREAETPPAVTPPGPDPR